MNNPIECSESETFSSAAQKNFPERTIRVTFGENMEAWQISCFWMMVTSSVTQYWHCPICKLLTQLTFKMGAERHPQKTEVICYVADLDIAPLDWKIRKVRLLASVSTAVPGKVTLGVAAGLRQHIADQLLAKADVIRAIHELVQLCQDTMTEFALLRESPGISRINHILKVHGHTILQEKEAATIFEVGQRSLERLFPGFAEDSSEQATLSASLSGIGYKEHAMLPALHTFWT